jgi:two-component system C4-dicarboxylate transport response regulator DctD
MSKPELALPGVVVVDDDEAACLSLGQMLRLRRYRVQVFSSAEAALAWPALPEADCVVSDVKMPGMDGEEFLAELRRRRIPPPVVMITGHGDVAMAVRCLQAGAYDFVEKPFQAEVILASVARAVERAQLGRESERLRRLLAAGEPGELGRFGLVGLSRAMQDVYAQVEVVARTDAPAVVLGETGVGKELVARAIHDQSGRAAGPFVALNAGALPDSVLESELFGHARGAFTGAVTARDGKLVSASGGTLLMDEIESLSLRAQVQLLRVLEDGLVQPVGGDGSVRVSVRLVCTSKQDLSQLVRSGAMREDFFHRVAVLSVSVPPLRERLEDVPLLAAHLMRSAAERTGLPLPHVPEASLREMTRHPWPGNVRELKNALERMLVTQQGGQAGPFVPDEAFGQEAGRLLSLPSSPGRLRDELERSERAVIEAALAERQGEVSATALALGISRRALYERMRKYDLDKERFKP